MPEIAFDFTGMFTTASGSLSSIGIVSLKIAISLSLVDLMSCFQMCSLFVYMLTEMASFEFVAAAMEARRAASFQSLIYIQLCSIRLVFEASLVCFDDAIPDTIPTS